MNQFKKKVQNRERLIGTLLNLPTASVSEVLSNLGFDWLWVDMEHGSLNLETVQAILQAKRSDCAGMVRVPINDEAWIKRVLDLGPDGIIVPQLKTAKDARLAVARAKYPPVGIRSFGAGRASLYGVNSLEYKIRANDDVSVFVQVEHVDAVANIKSIIEVPGVDAVVIGPYDLSASFGKLGEINDPEIQTAIVTVRDACSKAKMPLGIFTADSETAIKYLNQGFQLICVGIDTHFLWKSAKACLDSVKANALTKASV